MRKKKIKHFTVTVTAKVTPEQKALFLKFGGSKLIREMLDKIKVQNRIKNDNDI